MQRNWNLRRISRSPRKIHPSLDSVSMHHCSRVLSIDKHHTKNNLGKKGFIYMYASRSQTITEES